jgi:hypothetical protein
MLISTDTAAWVEDILATSNNSSDSETLASVANWADSVTKTEPWSMPLHFINVQDCVEADAECTFVYARDCAGDACVAGAISNYTTRLATLASGTSDLYEALKFAVHFVGDAHQPLHCARDVDRGGNLIKDINYTVTDQGDQFDLHQVWDFGLIENRMAAKTDGDIGEYAKYIAGTITDADAEEWLKCSDGRDKGCSSSWGQESVDAALEYAYVDMDGKQIEAGDTITEGYEEDRVLVVERRLAMGGVRLARILDDIAEKRGKSNTVGML